MVARLLVGLDVWLALLPLQPVVLIPQPLIFLTQGHNFLLLFFHDIEDQDERLACACDILNEVRVEVIKHGYYGRLSRRIRLPRIFGKILFGEQTLGHFRQILSIVRQ